MDEERLLDLGGDFTLANAETALELRERNLIAQLQRIEEQEAAFAARVESFEEVSRNLGSTANIEVISMLTVSLNDWEKNGGVLYVTRDVHACRHEIV